MDSLEAIKIGKHQWRICEGVIVDSRGDLGWFWTLWNNQVLNMKFTFQNLNWILTRFMNAQLGNIFNILNIYIPISYRELNIVGYLS